MTAPPPSQKLRRRRSGRRRRRVLSSATAAAAAALLILTSGPGGAAASASSSEPQSRMQDEREQGDLLRGSHPPPRTPRTTQQQKQRRRRQGGNCLPAEAVTERLEEEHHGGLVDVDRPSRDLTSVRIPGTASTKLNHDVNFIRGSSERFRSFLAEDGCEALCFHHSDRRDGDEGGRESDDGDDEHVKRQHAPAAAVATSQVVVDPFVRFTGEMQKSHLTYDAFIKDYDEEDDFDAPFLLTQIRDPIQYARKFYTARGMFDLEAKFPKDITFEEWIDLAPWRTNQMTRMLGRENMDQRLVPGNDLIVSPPANDRDDAYMQHQNSLGGDSPILQKAWERLSTRFAWFGLFHRLAESYELLAFTFCTSEDWGDRGASESEKYKYRGMELLEYMRKRREGGLDPTKKGRASRKKLQEIHARLLEINALDVILLRRAEELFDKRIKEMREMKERGVKCKFMREVEVTCAGEADAILGTDGISHFDLFY